jgi:hypothetical protein
MTPAAQVRSAHDITLQYDPAAVEVFERTVQRWDKWQGTHFEPTTPDIFVQARVTIGEQTFPLMVRAGGGNSLECWLDYDQCEPADAACAACGLSPEELWAAIEPEVERIQDELLSYNPNAPEDSDIE